MRMYSNSKIKGKLEKMTPEEWMKMMFCIEEMAMIMRKMPPPGSTYKYEGKELSGKDISTGKLVSINCLKYPRIKDSSDSSSKEYFEPDGIYLTQSMGYVPKGWTSGIVTFNNPLVMDRSDQELIHYKTKPLCTVSAEVIL